MLSKSSSTKLLAGGMVAASGLAAVLSCSAPAGASQLASSAQAASAVPAAHAHATEHLTAYADDDGPTSKVIATGVIGDYGKAVSIYPDGTIDPEHDSELSLELAHGSFRLDMASLDKAFKRAIARDFPTAAATCSGTVAVTGKVPVIPGSGTGAYRAVRGTFTLTATLDEVDGVSAAHPCDGTAAFLSQAIVITGPGTITL